MPKLIVWLGTTAFYLACYLFITMCNIISDFFTHNFCSMAFASTHLLLEHQILMKLYYLKLKSRSQI